MGRSSFRLMAAVLWLFAGSSLAQVEVSQVYGDSGTTVSNHNRFLVAVSKSGAEGAPLPAHRLLGPGDLAATSGKVFLANGPAALPCNGSLPCTGLQRARIIDLVGYRGADFSGGAASAPTLVPSRSAQRNRAGCDIGNIHFRDFTAPAPSARNVSTTANSCQAEQRVLDIFDSVSPEGNGPNNVLSNPLLVSLNGPAGPGGVSFSATARAGTATAMGAGPDPDFIPQDWTVVIPEGEYAMSFRVPMVGDTRDEPDETFIITLSNVIGATLGDGVGEGIIENDDLSLLPIAGIQGSGQTSPVNGSVVTTEGIVTARTNDGFYLQSSDEERDGDAATSEGLFVFTSTAPPVAAAVGNRLRVSGTVSEFAPNGNLNQPSVTRLVGLTLMSVLATDVRGPNPILLDYETFSQLSAPGSAERYEGMQVGAFGRVVAGSEGEISEADATAGINGVFHMVVHNFERPAREPGISVFDNVAIPAGKIPPRFDTNPERLRVDSLGQPGATAFAVDAGGVTCGMAGVLDYFDGSWTLLPNPGEMSCGGEAQPTAVDVARYEEATVGSFDLRRFFDEVDDGNGAPTLTAAALDKRLTKASLAICDFLRTPDILGVVEVENLRVLGLLADRINASCASAPAYVPYLVQGNDVGGINVGFLVSARSLGPVNRVDVVEVVQLGKDTLLTHPDASTSLLNDRPPLLLRAVVNQDNGATFPVTVIVNHLRSLDGIDDPTSGTRGWATRSEQVRSQRLQQALFLANAVEARQQADPGEHIVLLGQFNAFPFNDGYADVMGVIRGEEAAEPNVLTYAASPVSAALVDGSELIAYPPDRYAHVLDGNAQTLDHVLLNEALVMEATGLRLERARINADFGVHNSGIPGSALRVSEHDPVRLAIGVAEFRTADLSITASAMPTTLAAGGTAEFRVVVDSEGPNSAVSPAVALVFDALFPVAISIPVSWTCTTPEQSEGKTRVTCTTATLVAGGQAVFDAFVDVPSNAPTRTLQMGAAVASQSPDRSGADNRANASVNVLAVLPAADLGVRLIGGPTTTIPAGGIATMVAQVRNAGPNATSQTTVTFTGNVAPNRASVVPPAGWTCVAGAQGNGNLSTVCTAAGSFASGARANFTFNITAPNVQGQPTLEFNISTGASGTNDPVPVNNSIGRTLQVTGAPVAVPVISGRG